MVEENKVDNFQQIIQKKVSEFKKQFENQEIDYNQCDICFLIDITSSMKNWIDASQETIKEIINYIQGLYPKFSMRFSVVGYRDYEETPEERFQIFQLNKNIEEGKEFLKSLTAKGGSDLAEDVNGGIQKALSELDWKNNINIIFHIGDAPAHGKLYHNFKESDTYDMYPSGAPEDVPFSDLFNNIKTFKINYYFLRINKQTDKMYSKFQELCPNISQIDMKNFNDNYKQISQNKINNEDYKQIFFNKITNGIVKIVQFEKYKGKIEEEEEQQQQQQAEQIQKPQPNQKQASQSSQNTNDNEEKKIDMENDGTRKLEYKGKKN